MFSQHTINVECIQKPVTSLEYKDVFVDDQTGGLVEYLSYQEYDLLGARIIFGRNNDGTRFARHCFDHTVVDVVCFNRRDGVA